MDMPVADNGFGDDRSRRQAAELRILLSKLLQPPIENSLADVELSPREFRLLLSLMDRSEMIMTDLAAVIRAPLSTVTRMVDRLETKGLIERFRSEEDRRIVLVRNTSTGMKLRETVEGHQLETARRMLAPLSPGEREILLELMAKLIKGMSDSGTATVRDE